MKIGQWIKQYRNERGMSMQEFADACGFSKAYIGLLEKGINPKTNKPMSPTMKAFRKIAAAVNLDVNDLLAALDGSQPITVKVAKLPPPPVPEEEKENLLMTLYADNPMIIKWLKENNFVLRGNIAAIKDDGKLLLKHAILSSIENEEKEKEK